jgi:hypothetical protein
VGHPRAPKGLRYFYGTDWAPEPAIGSIYERYDLSGSIVPFASNVGTGEPGVQGVLFRHAVWLYFRFTLSLRDVEDLLAERGIEVSYEAIRTWTPKFGAQFAQNLRRSRSKPIGRWHLDESAPRRREGGVMI